MTKRLEILKNSLIKKETSFNEKLDVHFSDVKQGQGEPMRGHRRGNQILARWEKQDDQLRKLDADVEITKNAIEREESKIGYCERTLKEMPDFMGEAVENGKIKQWRKYPNMFFVSGVDKARIIYNIEKNQLSNKFTENLTAEEKEIFESVYRELKLLNLDFSKVVEKKPRERKTEEITKLDPNQTYRIVPLKSVSYF